ncbi:MAG TPA: NADPH:quinone reductase [Actinoplanes sp.]|nr:NADPH:quinone reductase [Actinoplanes sp.]
MKSIVYRKTGDTSVLELVDKDLREPRPGEVRIKVVVSGVNPTDWKMRSGATGQMAFPEVTPHQDGAGVVDAVGPDVDTVRPGDRVWTFLAADGRPDGTAQEYTLVPAGNVVKLPDDVSMDVGASLGVPAVTAHRALTVAEDGPQRLQPGALTGRTVLVAGGAGAVGHAAVQLARWAGATVVATVSGLDKARLASSAGAHQVVNYRETGAAEAIRRAAPDGVDVIVEVAPAANAELDLAVLRNAGTIAVYANNGGSRMTLDVRSNMVLNARWQFLLLYTVGRPALTAAVEDISAALRDGALPVGAEHGLPLVRFPLAATADAHAAVENETVGKVLVDVAEEGA